jgi:multidrug efflux pump subunit AcrA (membrane-fusion protein)
MPRLTQYISGAQKKVLHFIDTRPFTAFIGGLVILFALVLIGNYIRKPEVAAEKPEAEPKLVEVYENGESPSVKLTAKIEKSGVITIMAQTAGVVQKLPVTEGSYVKRGVPIVSLSTNYNGANIASISRQITQKSVSFTNETYDIQKDLLNKQRDVVKNVSAQNSELRDINKKSIDETKSLIALNEDIIGTIDRNIKELEDSNVGGVNDSSILAAKQGKSGALAALNNLKAGLRSLEYSTADDQEPRQLDTINKDSALKQLDIQEKSLDLTRDLGNLQLKLARVAESLMYPTTPCPGIVERVLVKVGQSVTPGTPLAIIRADQRDVTAVVSVPSQIASKISRVETSVFMINGTAVSVAPRYVSVEPTNGTLHSVLYNIPGEYEKWLPNGEQISVTVPVGSATIGAEKEFVPLDAIYQTQDAAYIYIVSSDEGGKKHAQVKNVTLGAVSGSYVTVESGLDTNDVVVLTRGISDGDPIRTE